MSDGWTPANIAAIVVSISTAIGAIFAKPTVDAIIRLGNWWMANRQARAEEHERNYKLNDMGHKRQIVWYDLQMTKLEKRIELLELNSESFRREHQECREENLVLEAKYHEVKKENEALKMRVEELEKNERRRNLN